MPFAIVADLPLGTYRGAGRDGRPEAMPSVARLHSALLSAAGFGPRAVLSDHGTLAVSEDDQSALRWLEEHPPESVHIPALHVNVGQGIAYRDDGTVKKSKAVLTIKKLAKPPAAGTAIDGRFAWIWRESPPESVRAALEQLLPDVAYLGTSESPVRLTAVSADDIRPTHELDQEAGLFAVGAAEFERPLPGRMAELMEAHRVATGKSPSVAGDRIGTDEKSQSPVPVRRAVGTVRYRSRLAPALSVPWAQVIVLPLQYRVPEPQRVRWAVAAHRALIRLIGYGAPPLLTGAYPDGVARPANRLAIHVLDATMPVATGLHHGSQPPSSLALLVPADADSADLETLRQAVRSLTSLRGPGGKVIRTDPARLRALDGSRFWLPPEPGTVRLWRTVPAAVPDTRGADGWTFAHAALLSLGFVWKDTLDVRGRGTELHRQLVAAVSDRGAAVVHVKAVRASDVRDYAHNVNEHAVVRPYVASLRLGDLAGPGTVAAIGQSRHLGGGLLVPLDIPEGTLAGNVAVPGVCASRNGG